jgi:L-amino acid N-acyltransferase YncA
MTQAPQICVRSAMVSDAPALCALLNQIIERGGTTAFQGILTTADFTAMYLENPQTVSCYVACLDDGRRVGFQHVDSNPELPSNWGDIATFAKIDSPIRGIGSALFQTTLVAMKKAGITAINATIRADNRSGLGYYSKMGFVDYAINKTVPLIDGTPVDRISKKHLIK